MRRQYVVVAAITTWLALTNIQVQWAHAEQSFPYRAYTAEKNASVRSGPGDDFYVTDQLDWGSKVEVYRHDKGEWCAIRPPAHSFSWVSAEHVKLTDDLSLGRIIPVIEKLDGAVIVTADHGNADEMFEVDKKSGDFKRDAGGNPKSKTSHTLNEVPCYIYVPGNDTLALDDSVQNPGIANVAATTLQLLGLERPEDYEPSILK